MRDVQAAKVAGLAVAAACLATVVLFGQDHPAKPHRHGEGQKLKNPVPSSADSLAAGAKVYSKFCATCHGPTGKGDGRGAPEGSHPADLTDATWQHGSSDGEIFLSIKNGIGPDFFMDSWEGKIPEQDMWNVVNYIKSLGTKK